LFTPPRSQLQGLASKPSIYVITPPPLYPPNPYSMNASIINVLYGTLLRKIAQESGAVPQVRGVDGDQRAAAMARAARRRDTDCPRPQVIDIFAALGGSNLTQPNITCDGCHPVDAGYIEIAQTMAPIMLGDAKAQAILADEP